MSDKAFKLALFDHPFLLPDILEDKVAGVEVRGVFDAKLNLLIAQS